MTLFELVQFLDTGVSVTVLLWILYRMERGHTAAVARLWQHIEKLSDDEQRDKLAR